MKGKRKIIEREKARRQNAGSSASGLWAHFRSLASHYYALATPFTFSTMSFKSSCICITVICIFLLKISRFVCFLQSFVVVSAFVLLCRPTRTFFLSHYVVVGATGQSGKSHAACARLAREVAR